MEERENIVVLTDDDGQEKEFEYLDFFDYEDKEYVVLLGLEDEDEESGTVVIFEVNEVDEETDEFLPVPDDVLDNVFEEFKKRYDTLEEE